MVTSMQDLRRCSKKTQGMEGKTSSVRLLKQSPISNSDSSQQRNPPYSKDRLGERICKLLTQQRINIQNIAVPRETQWQEKISNQERGNPFNLNSPFSKAEIQMTQQIGGEKAPLLLATKKVQIKTTMRYPFNPAWIAVVWNSGSNKCWHGCGKLEHPLRADVPGKAAEDGQVLGPWTHWLQPGPALAVVIIWGMNQQMKNFSL